MPHMILRPFGVDEGLLIRSLRLRSLAEAPYAFGAGSHEAESRLPEAYWHELAAQLGGGDPKWGDRCVGYVVLDGEEACGTATCFLCPEVAGRAYLTAAWVDPRYRGRGLWRRLVEQALGWAADRGADHLRLWMDDTNPSAAGFYEAMGFIATGQSQPTGEGATARQSAYERRLGQAAT